jgi:hypothetical protein
MPLGGAGTIDLSMARIRAETACWLTPIYRAALFRLPIRATTSSTSNAPVFRPAGKQVWVPARKTRALTWAIVGLQVVKASLVPRQARGPYRRQAAAASLESERDLTLKEVPS